MYTLGVVGLFSMMIFAFYKNLFLIDPLPLFTISLLLKIVNQARHPPPFSAKFTKSSVFFILKASLTKIHQFLQKFIENKMELLQSQAPAERELLGDSAVRTLDIRV